MTEILAGDEVPVKESSVEATLQLVRDEPDVERQFCALDRNTNYYGCRLPGRITAADFDAMVGFAADPGSSVSSLVRAQAFEAAVDLLGDSLRQGNDAELERRREQLDSLKPAANLSAAKNPDSTGNSLIWREGYRYRDNVRRLAAQEDIREELLFPDWHSYSGTPLGMSDSNPVEALKLLDYLADRPEEFVEFPVNGLTKLMPLALEIQEKTGRYFAEISDNKARSLGEDAKETIELVNNDNPEAGRYIELINGLAESAAKLKTAFPPEFADGVETGVKDLLASTVYAVNQHLKNGGETSVKLPLNNREDALELNLEKGEPLYMLTALSLALSRLGGTLAGPNLGTVGINVGGGYQAFRLVSGSSAPASVYIRPNGASDYDHSYEYGRPSEGVEASISYVVDPLMLDNELLEFGKHFGAGNDSRISIRLDREGVAPDQRLKPGVNRDPTIEQGTLSLDVGSILGRDEWLGTKLGRFLAWGNLLRSQKLDKSSGLNHVTRYFSEADGGAARFGAAASELAEQFESRRLSKKEVAKRFLGASARTQLN
jgi:hypothetical protein